MFLYLREVSAVPKNFRNVCIIARPPEEAAAETSEAFVDHHGALHVALRRELLVANDVGRQLLARNRAESAVFVEVEVVVHRDQGHDLEPALASSLEHFLDQLG